MSYEAFDHLELRCPQLGGEVTFGYCRKLQEGLPCNRALVCWELKFPVIDYFRLVLKDETFERIFATPSKSRVEKFLDTVDQAKKRLEQQP